MNWMAFYNYRGLHSSLGYLSRMQYEQRWYEVKRPRKQGAKSSTKQGQHQCPNKSHIEVSTISAMKADLRNMYFGQNKSKGKSKC